MNFINFKERERERERERELDERHFCNVDVALSQR